MSALSGALSRRPSAGLLFPPLSGAGMTRPMERRESSNDLVTLLSAIARQDRSALGQLYGQTSAKLYGICRRMMASEADAEDVLQDVYLAVWRNAGRFDPSKASPITWLCVVTRNKAIDRLRQKRSDEPIDAAAELADKEPLAFDVMSDDEDQGRLAKCLEQINRQTSDLIQTAFFEGATYPQLAASQEVPLATMKSRIRRGLLSLRKCLEL